MMNICGETWSPDKTPEYYSRDLPNMFLAAKDNCKKYDVVVVDEGQDLLNTKYLECIDILVNGGLTNGCWSIFYDPNQNLFNPKSELNTLLPQLRKIAASYNLTVNCRNTRQIAIANTLVTNIPQASRVKATGPTVEYFKYSTLSEELSLVIKQLKRLKEDGVNVGEIVLLSAYTIDNPRCCLSCGEIPSEIGRIKTDGFLWQAKKMSYVFQLFRLSKDSKLK